MLLPKVINISDWYLTCLCTSCWTWWSCFNVISVEFTVFSLPTINLYGDQRNAVCQERCFVQPWAFIVWMLRWVCFFFEKLWPASHCFSRSEPSWELIVSKSYVRPYVSSDDLAELLFSVYQISELKYQPVQGKAIMWNANIPQWDMTLRRNGQQHTHYAHHISHFNFNYVPWQTSQYTVCISHRGRCKKTQISCLKFSG